MNEKSIKSWDVEDRPREKMLLKGKSALSNAELIAILMGSGSAQESAVDLAKRVLRGASSLNELGKKSIDFFTSFKGIGEAKAVTISAALELGRRRQAEAPLKRIKISSSQDAYNVMGPLLEDLPHEEFWMLLLNRNNVIIVKEKITSGGVAATVVDPKLIFKSALANLASGIILFHNHPSGQTKPSLEDVNITKKLTEAGKLLEIKVLDHIIIGHKGYYSFRDENQI